MLLRVIDPRSGSLHDGNDFGSMCDVSLPSESRRPGPPHNSGVRDLVAGKRQRLSCPKIEVAKRGFRGWHERRYLPQRDETGLTQFVTFRFMDWGQSHCFLYWWAHSFIG